MGYDVFISHSSKDKAVAGAVCAALEADGIRCWIAPRDLVAGESWANGILRGIGECRAMVLVFSAAANASQHVRREVERAVFREIPVAPVRIEDLMPSGDMEYFLAGSHWMDALTPPLAGHLPALVSQVRKLLAAGAAAPPAGPADRAHSAAPPPAAAELPATESLLVETPTVETEAPADGAGAVPSFGRYKPVRQVATRNGATAAYVARAEGPEGPDGQYFVKLYRPPVGVQTDTEISAGVSAFLERTRVQQRAALPSGHVATVHDVQRVAGGAYSVTTYYPWTAKALIDGKVLSGSGRKGAAALYWIARGVVEGIAELKRSRGAGHGNIKPANVLLDGPPDGRRLRAFLSDPVGPDQVGLNGAGDESNDLFALGRVLYEMVAARAWKATAWPIAPSATWNALRPRADGWRELCNRLLNPNPADGVGRLEDARAQLASLAPARAPAVPRA